MDAFQGAHPEFRPLSCAEILESQRIMLDTGERLRLWPHRHATDGFFGAACVKIPYGQTA
jgi:16S rRNA (cytosine967-C5)-methyltransferase